jgi:hypothetical protein
MGTLYERGEGIEKDYLKAMGLYRKSCEQLDSLGCTRLAMLFEKGLGIEKDLASALQLYKEACKLGEPSACDRQKVLENQQ